VTVRLNDGFGTRFGRMACPLDVFGGESMSDLEQRAATRAFVRRARAYSRDIDGAATAATELICHNTSPSIATRVGSTRRWHAQPVRSHVVPEHARRAAQTAVF
jgi:hypothetical protein